MTMESEIKYLQDINRIKPLDKEAVIELAKQIDAHGQKVLRQLLASPVAQEAIVAMGDAVIAGKIPPGDVLHDWGGENKDSGQSDPMDRFGAAIRGVEQLHRAGLDCGQRVADADCGVGERKKALEDLEHLAARICRLLEPFSFTAVAIDKMEKAIEDRMAADPGREDLKRILSSARRSRAKCAEAKNKMVRANLRLVTKIARRYANLDLSFLDLVQEGNIGLIKAVDRFDHRRGYAFSTYAAYWIKQAISRAIANKSRTIRIPVHVTDLCTKIFRTSQTLAAKLNREPSTDEVAEHIQIPRANVRKVMRFTQNMVSLDKTVNEDEGSRIGDFIEDDKLPNFYRAVFIAELKSELKGIISNLSEREQQALSMRFGIQAQSDSAETAGDASCAGHLSLSNQIESRALRKLRHPVHMARLAPFVQ